MDYLKHAPLCSGTRQASAGRHKWGAAVKLFHGVSVWKDRQQCLNGCGLNRVIEYTKNGNHVAGYFQD